MTRKAVRPIETLTESEVLAILDAFGPGACGRRNAALVCLMWRTGLRLAEAISLHLRDLAPGPPAELRIRRGKGHKPRTVGVRADAMAMVQRWLEIRRDLEVPGAVLFCTHSGQPLDQGYIRRTLARKAAAAGVEKRVHPHGLRHTFAMTMDRSGKSLEVIKLALGHASIATTDAYLRDYSAADVVEAMTADDQNDE